MATMGERIKQLRKEIGMTQTALAETLGVTKGTVSTWETNSRVPSFETLVKMSDVFMRSSDYIMGRSDDATPTAQNEDLEDLAAASIEDDLTEYASPGQIFLHLPDLQFLIVEQRSRQCRVRFSHCQRVIEMFQCPRAA